MSDSINIYYDEDASIDILRDRTIAIIGYGNQGRAQGLNMRESGLDSIIVGNIKDESWERAKEDGFEVHLIEEAAELGDILTLLVPDEVAPDVYRSKIKDNLKEGDLIDFASGYNITYNFIDPPKYVDVVMVAPRMIGAEVRRLYKEGDGAPAFMAINQDYSGKAKEISLGMAKAMGLTRAGVMEVSAEMETKSDLLTEQGLMPIFLSAMIAKYELEKEEGIPPEAILTEEYLSKEIAHVFRQVAEKGVMGQMKLHSRTSQYGQLSRTNKILENMTEDIDFEGIKNYMKKQLGNISRGEFAREWSSEQSFGRPTLKRLYKKFVTSDYIKDEQKTMKELGLKREEDDVCI